MLERSIDVALESKLKYCGTATPNETRIWNCVQRLFPPVLIRRFTHGSPALRVLFEDLRIELAGQAAQELGRLDEGGKTGRKLYFLFGVPSQHSMNSAH